MGFTGKHGWTWDKQQEWLWDKQQVVSSHELVFQWRYPGHVSYQLGILKDKYAVGLLEHIGMFPDHTTTYHG